MLQSTVLMQESIVLLRIPRSEIPVGLQYVLHAGIYEGAQDVKIPIKSTPSIGETIPKQWIAILWSVKTLSYNIIPVRGEFLPEQAGQ